MADRLSPDVRRRRLSLQLRRLRTPGVTAADVARQLGWPASRLTRIERNEWKLPAIRDVEALLIAYDVKDQAARDRMLALVAESRIRGWWSTLPDLPPKVGEYIAYEWESRVLRVWVPSQIPGLLQTEAYAREAFLGAAPQQESAVGQLLVAHHRRTTELLHGDNPVTLHAILDEAALRRAVGGREVMREQLQHLVELSHLDHVRIQAVPASAGALPVRAGFRIITYPEPLDPELIYQESASDGIWLNLQPDDTLDPQVVALEMAFERLVGLGLSRAKTRRLVGEILSG